MISSSISIYTILIIAMLLSFVTVILYIKDKSVISFKKSKLIVQNPKSDLKTVRSSLKAMGIALIEGNSEPWSQALSTNRLRILHNMRVRVNEYTDLIVEFNKDLEIVNLEPDTSKFEPPYNEKGQQQRKRQEEIIEILSNASDLKLKLTVTTVYYTKSEIFTSWIMRKEGFLYWISLGFWLLFFILWIPSLV